MVWTANVGTTHKSHAPTFLNHNLCHINNWFLRKSSFCCEIAFIPFWKKAATRHWGEETWNLFSKQRENSIGELFINYVMVFTNIWELFVQMGFNRWATRKTFNNFLEGIYSRLKIHSYRITSPSIFPQFHLALHGSPLPSPYPLSRKMFHILNLWIYLNGKAGKYVMKITKLLFTSIKYWRAFIQWGVPRKSESVRARMECRSRNNTDTSKAETLVTEKLFRMESECLFE